MSSNSTKEALADAVAGVAGSLVSMLIFYPIDVIKTNLQASLSSSPSSSTKITSTETTKNTDKHVKLLSFKFLQSIFRGLHYKTAHTITSSFAYFFVYSLIQSQHKNLLLLKEMRKIRSRNTHANDLNVSYTYQPSTSMRLLLSAIAGMANVTLTFPLDVLAARSQTNANNNESSKSADDSIDCDKCNKIKQQQIMDDVWKDINEKEQDESRYNNNHHDNETEEDNLSYKTTTSYDDGLSFSDDNNS